MGDEQQTNGVGRVQGQQREPTRQIPAGGPGIGQKGHPGADVGVPERQPAGANLSLQERGVRSELEQEIEISRQAAGDNRPSSPGQQEAETEAGGEVGGTPFRCHCADRAYRAGDEGGGVEIPVFTGMTGGRWSAVAGHGSLAPGYRLASACS